MTCPRRGAGASPLFPPRPDWPVFNDLDHVASRDHDHLDNHQVSGHGQRGRPRTNEWTPAQRALRVNAQTWRWAVCPGHCQGTMGSGSGEREQMNLRLLPKAALSSLVPRDGQRRENPKQQQRHLVPAGLSPKWFGQYVWASVSGRGLRWVPDVLLTAQLSVMLWRNKTGTCSRWETQW